MPHPLISLATRWPAARTDSSLADGPQVFVPALDRFPVALREIVGLLPVTDINGALLAALAGREASRPEAGDRPVAGLFAADPFLDMSALVEHLRGAGIGRVANFPTLQHFDGATAEGFEAVGYDVRAEFAVLNTLASQGFEVVAYVATLKAAECALAAGFSTLAFHPGPPPVPSSERAALGRIAALAAQAGAQLLVHAADSPDGDQPISP